MLRAGLFALAAPFAPAGARWLIVSPDADLAFVPFEALRLDGRYLVVQFFSRVRAGADHGG